MALTVYNEDAHQVAAQGVYNRAISLNAYRVGNADMGGFHAANSVQHTAIGTSGAGPCQIIVVHKNAGVGALGHYAGTADPMLILAGLEKMVQRLGGGPIDTVVYAAATGVGDTKRQQKVYEIKIFGGTHLRFPGATVLWPSQDAANNWGSAVYLPLTAELALFHSMPGLGFTGLADGTQGVREYTY